MKRSRTRHLIAAAPLPICAAGRAPQTSAANCEFGSVGRQAAVLLSTSPSLQCGDASGA